MGDHVSLDVLTPAFPPDVVDRAIARTLADQARNMLLPSRLMAYCVMAMALFAPGSYEEVMRSLMAGWSESRCDSTGKRCVPSPPVWSGAAPPGRGAHTSAPW
ncbi:transposase domain-containing protein [bacterium RCC_150]